MLKKTTVSHFGKSFSILDSLVAVSLDAMASMEKCNLDELLEALSEMDQAAIQQAEALSCLMKITSGGMLWCWSQGKSIKETTVGKDPVK